jgi:putative ABC transport system permease protein
VRVYRLLLLVFPADFRRRFGDDMSAVFEDRLRAARAQGPVAIARLWTSTVADLTAHGIAERRARRWSRRRTSMWTSLGQDVRFGIRSFTRKPGFTAAAVATLALGIGANVAVFSVVRAVLLPELPYPDADRIVNVYLMKGDDSIGSVASGGAVGAWMRGSNEAFLSLSAYDLEAASLVGPAGPDRVRVGRVSPAIFDVMGLTPLLGRPLMASDGAAGSGAVVLSHAFWMRAFGADRHVVGSAVLIDGESRTVVGVMPPGAALPDPDVGSEVDLWLPLALSSGDLSNFRRYDLSVIGRLRPGVTPEQATRTLSAAQASTEGSPVGEAASVRGLQADASSRLRQPVLLLQGVTIAVLLIACVNVANLLLATTTARSREFAVRRALGAGGWRIARQLLTESLLLAAAGGLAGVALAAWLAPLVVAVYPPGLPLGQRPIVATVELTGALAFCTLTVLVFGLTPVLAARRSPAGDALGTGRQTHGPRELLAHRALVAMEVALALLLVTGGSLLIRSYLTLTNQPLGFNPDGVLTAEISLPARTYPDGGSRSRFITTLVNWLSERPDVRAVAVASSMPFGGSFAGGQYLLDTGTGDPVREMVFVRQVSPQYLDALEGELVQGRFLSDADSAAREPVAVVNTGFAARHGGSVVGMRVRPSATAPWIRIVGVIRDTRSGFVNVPVLPELTLPAAQAPPARFRLMVRTNGEPGRLGEPVRAAVHALDPQLPVSFVTPLSSLVRSSVAKQRFNMSSLALLAALALVLALIGIYGVTAYTVVLRTREIGIRTALGARPVDVRVLIMRQGLLPLVAGVGIGLVGAYWSVRVLESELFEIAPRDPLTFAAAAGLFIVAGVISNWLPAGRALRVHPAATLRAE